MPRKAISKRIRFEVFKRDGFTCQYCGRKAPEVVLQVDHMRPVSKGGANEILNYVTSCVDCNLGKGPREISDESILAKQQGQLEELNEKREQLRMMIKWRDGLKDLESMKVDEVVGAYKSCVPGWSLNERGLETVAKWVREFPLDIILEAIDVSRSKLHAVEGKLPQENVDEFMSYIPRVAFCKLRDRKDPGLGELLRLRGYLRKRLPWVDESGCMRLLRSAQASGISSDEMRAVVSGCSSWTRFQNTILEMMGTPIV